MKLHESRQGNVDVFHLEGEIDLHYAPALRALFQAKASQRCPALVVDLTGVPFIDSTGIAVLLEYLRDASGFGGKFCLAAPTDHVRYVFEIIRLQESLPIFMSTAAAIAALSNGDLLAPIQPLFSATSSTASEPLTASRAA
jgi:anti-sigma B factor antagonist